MIVAIIFGITSRERLVRGLKPTNCDSPVVKSRNDHYEMNATENTSDSLAHSSRRRQERATEKTVDGYRPHPTETCYHLEEVITEQ